MRGRGWRSCAGKLVRGRRSSEAGKKKTGIPGFSQDAGFYLSFTVGPDPYMEHAGLVRIVQLGFDPVRVVRQPAL